MHEENGLPGITGWVLAGIATIIATLSGIVQMFYRTQIADYKANILALEKTTAALTVRADKCEDEREELRVRYAVLEQRVSELESYKKHFEEKKL